VEQLQTILKRYSKKRKELKAFASVTDFWVDIDSSNELVVIVMADKFRCRFADLLEYGIGVPHIIYGIKTFITIAKL
jgi:hypothetical protein